jgi:SHS2 domain-containing protein
MSAPIAGNTRLGIAQIPARVETLLSVYRWLDHMGEMELELEGASEEELYRDAVNAFGELVHDEGGSPASHSLEVEARDRATLLAELLGELVFLVETEDFAPDRVRELELRDASLRAVIEGRRASPRHLVKAVTYHGLRFEQEGETWRASAVLDV